MLIGHFPASDRPPGAIFGYKSDIGGGGTEMKTARGGNPSTTAAEASSRGGRAGSGFQTELGRPYLLKSAWGSSLGAWWTPAPYKKEIPDPFGAGVSRSERPRTFFSVAPDYHFRAPIIQCPCLSIPRFAMALLRLQNDRPFRGRLPPAIRRQPAVKRGCLRLEVQ